MGEYPGGPVVMTLPSNAAGVGSIPGRGAKIPHASWPKNQNIKQKQYCNKFNKDFKNGPHQKKSSKKIAWSRVQACIILNIKHFKENSYLGYLFVSTDGGMNAFVLLRETV